MDIRCETTGKETYASQYHAERALDGLRRKFGDGPDGIDTLHAYRCPHCTFWHVGRRSRWRRRDITRDERRRERFVT